MWRSLTSLEELMETLFRRALRLVRIVLICMVLCHHPVRFLCGIRVSLSWWVDRRLLEQQMVRSRTQVLPQQPLNSSVPTSLTGIVAMAEEADWRPWHSINES